VIDAVEGLPPGSPSELNVTYPSDYHECLLTVEGVDACVRCTGVTLSVEFPRSSSPRELLTAFADVRRAFVLSKDAVLAGLL